MRFYDFPDAYDLFFNEDFEKDCMSFYKDLFAKKGIKDVFDCTVGTGKMTIPLAKLGYNVTGTDINRYMIKKAKQNFAKAEIMANLSECNILELSTKMKRQFDCVLSTGNSLGHLNGEELVTAIQQMDALVKPGGYLYIDSKNWDLVIQRQQRFYLFNPIVRDKGRVNYIQVWDYNKDDSITFNFLMFEEIDNKIVTKRQFYEMYYPFKTEVLIHILEQLNYENISFCKLGNTAETEMENIDWYAMIAEKSMEEISPKGKNKLTSKGFKFF